MKRERYLLPSLAVFVFGALTPPQIHAKGIYKLYSFTVSRGSVVSHVDPSFTLLVNDNTKCSIEFPAEDGSRTMFLRVWRDVVPGETAPAIDVNRIRVRGYNSAGEQIYGLRVDGFAFEHNESDEWTYQIEAIPKKVTRITIRFTGRYED